LDSCASAEEGSLRAEVCTEFAFFDRAH